MKSPQALILLSIIITTVFISWDRSSYPQKDNTRSTTKNFLTPPDQNPVPAAEDVLVQRIHGDNNHLLLIALYSTERYAGHFVTVDFNGAKVTFRDDAQGEDKIAGDHLFTAKIEADINAFRKLAMSRGDAQKRRGKS